MAADRRPMTDGTASLCVALVECSRFFTTCNRFCAFPWVLYSLVSNLRSALLYSQNVEPEEIFSSSFAAAAYLEQTKFKDTGKKVSTAVERCVLGARDWPVLECSSDTAKTHTPYSCPHVSGDKLLGYSVDAFFAAITGLKNKEMAPPFRIYGATWLGISTYIYTCKREKRTAGSGSRGNQSTLGSPVSSVCCFAAALFRRD